MTMMSISEAQNLYVNQMPVYNKKPVYIYRGQDLVAGGSHKPYGRVSPGYLGRVIGVRTEQGKIYLEIDDTNIYVDGISFYVFADHDALTTSKYDAPQETPGTFELLMDYLGSGAGNIAKGIGNTLVKFSLMGIFGFAIIKSLGHETAESIKEGAKKLTDKAKQKIKGNDND